LSILIFPATDGGETMHHIEIYVSNLENTKEFYSWILSVLGFELFQVWKDGFSYKKDEFYIVFVKIMIVKF